ncbi:MAG: hypothetical protein Kow0031_38150 [Anaerolineae bacterium]
MEQTVTLPTNPKFSRFDAIVVATMLVLLLGTLLLVWRGDAVGLQLVSTSPAGGAQGVSTRADIRLTFDQPLTAAEAAAPLLFNPPLTGQSRTEGATLIFSPDVPLAANTTYTVELAGGVQGQRGRALTEPVAWQFTTRRPELLFVGPDAGGVDQLFRLNPDGGQPVQLTREPVGVFDYQLAPDGSQLVYSAVRDDGGSDLFLLSPEGGERTLLLDCGGSVCNGPAWTPDSRRLVYERRTMLVPGAAPGPPRLWWLNLGGDTTPLFDDTQALGYGASWAPGGEWLSFVAPSSQGVQVYNVDDGRSIIVPSRMGGAAAWGPRDDAFLVPDVQATETGFAVHLLKASPEGGDLVNLSGTGEPVEDSSPAWSPDGEWVAFTRKVAGAAMGKQVWLMRPDGSQARYLTNDTNLHHGLPRWSPDGQWLVFQRFPLKEIDGANSLWLLNVESGETRPLVENGNRPTWLP